MSETAIYLTIIGIIGLIFCGAISSYIAEAKGLRGGVWFLIGFFIGIFGVLIVAVVSKNEEELVRRQVTEGKLRKCPACAEFVQYDAKKCRYCNEIFEHILTISSPQNSKSKSKKRLIITMVVCFAILLLTILQATFYIF